MAVTMLSASGALDYFTNWIAPSFRIFRFPGTGTSACLASPNFRQRFHCGFNRNLPKLQQVWIYGRVASVMMGSTETTFYAIAVYFGSVGIKKTRHAIPAALMADTTGYIMSVLAVNLFFR